MSTNHNLFQEQGEPKQKFDMNYGLNTASFTYSACVQAKKKYIEGLDIDVELITLQTRENP